MFLCVILSVGTLWYTNSFSYFIVWLTWFVFFIDYLVRFFYSKEKKTFMKKNLFDFIALIPLDAFFQSAKIIRLFRFFRLKIITKRYSNPLIAKMKNKNFKNVASLSFISVFLSTIPFYFFEPLVNSYKEAFVWSFTSIVFFGSNEATPETFIGKIVIVFLTILGVVLHAVIFHLLYKVFLSKKEK